MQFPPYLGRGSTPALTRLGRWLSVFVACCLELSTTTAAALEVARAAASLDGVVPELPEFPRLTARTEVSTEAQLRAALQVPGNDVVLAADISLTGDLRLEANDVRLAGRRRLTGGSVRLARAVRRIALEEFTASQVAWDPPLTFDNGLGESVTDPSQMIHDVTVRELTLTGVPIEPTLHIRGNRTLVYRCHLRSTNSYCLFADTDSRVEASAVNPAPFGLTDLTVVACTLSNPGSGQANLRVHGCLRQIVSHCTLNTGQNFSLRSHEGSHLVYWGDNVLNGGGFMLTDHGRTPPDAIGSIFIRRLVVNYTNSNGPISVPLSGAGLARIGATGPSQHPITEPQVVLRDITIHDTSPWVSSFSDFFGGLALPANWTVVSNTWTRPPWPDWRAASFNGDELEQPGLSGETADPDRDGHSNLLEYALGLPAREANLLPLRVDRVTADQVEVLFRKDLRAQDATVTVEASTAMLADTWETAGAYYETETVEGTVAMVRAIIPRRAGEAERFIRLRVVRY